MTEHIQIVRKLYVGESAPAYSTAALLFGCTFPVRVESIDSDKLNHESGNTRYSARYSEATLREMESFRDTIRSMIENAETNDVISNAIGKAQRLVQVYIRSDPELHALSCEKRRCGKKAASDRYFMARRDIVVRMLKESSPLPAIAEAIELSLPAVIRRIGRDPELKELCDLRNQRGKK